MTKEKYRIAIVKMYEDTVRAVMREISDIEKIIIDSPDIGTAKDGAKELRQDIAELLQGYSTESTENWDRLRTELGNRLETDLDFNAPGNFNTETVSRHWAVRVFVRKMDIYRRNYIEAEKEEQ